MASLDSDLDAARFREYFGTRLTPRSFPEWLDWIDKIIREGGRRHLFGSHNLHSLYLIREESTMRLFYAACDSCYVDGAPIRWILKLAGQNLKREARFSLMDRFEDLLEYAQRRSWSVFYLGSSEQSVRLAGERLRREFPSLQINLHHGFFEDTGHILNLINDQRPDLLMVGMGMPKQEAWLLEHIAALDVAVATTTGATLDYFSGVQSRPSTFLSNLGLAWFSRLVHDPKRLWRRYLIEPFSLIRPTVKLLRRRD